jgi:hypothetical protein
MIIIKTVNVIKNQKVQQPKLTDIPKKMAVKRTIKMIKIPGRNLDGMLILPTQ